MSRRGRPKHPDILTPREAEVLDLLREGCSNEQIAERLGISISGVKYHVSEILSKLHLQNRTDAARWRPEERPWWARAVTPVAFAWRKIGVVSAKVSSVALVLSGAIVVAALAGLGLIAFLLFRDGGGLAETQAARTATPGKIVSPADQEPTASQEREYVFGAQSSWLAGANGGWLGGSRCEENAGAAFSDRAEDSTPARRVCTGLIYHTTDGGSTWREQYRGDVVPERIRFDGPERGMAIDTHGGDCVHEACPIAVLGTEDGGEHWAQTYTTVPLQHAELTFVGGEVWIVGAGCLEGLSDEAQRYGCETYLLKSNDGGHTWSQSSLPIQGSPHIARPTATDAWIATSTAGPGTAQIIATHDGGETWEALSHPAPESAWEASIFFSNAERGWLLIGGQPGAGAQMKEVFATYDGGPHGHACR